MDREDANLEEQSWLEEFLGEDWKQQLEVTITSSSASLKRRPFAALPCKALITVICPKVLTKRLL